MKLNDAINIAEEVIKTDRVKTSYEERGKILKEVMPKIKSGNFSVKLRTDRVEDIEYIARLINNKDLIKKIYFASGLKYEGEEPDFDDRMKAQNEIRNGKYKKLINDACKTKLVEILINSKVAPFVDIVKNFKQIVFKQAGSPTYPYTKFNYINGSLELISCHDSKFSFKKKSYNDSNSWKFGDKKALNKVKQNIKNTNEKFGE